MERNLEKELGYFTYTDMEDGNDEERIDYPSLFHLLTEILDRLETLENKQSKHEEKQKRLSQVAKSVSENMKEVSAEMQEVREDIKLTLENLK